MAKILVVGEVLMDFIEVDRELYAASIGGAPFNVGTNLARLGDKVTFIGQVGNDFFGEEVYDFVKKLENFDSKIETLNECNTTVALNAEDPNTHQRKFSFVRNNTADYKFNSDTLSNLDLSDFDLIHIGSLFLSKDESLPIIEKFLTKAKNEGKKISFDVNFRSDIFESVNEAISRYQKFIEMADFVKFSDEELKVFSLSEDKLLEMSKGKVIVVTNGSKGSMLYINGKIYMHNAYRVKVFDTVGAGDSFYSGFLHTYLNSDKHDDNEYINSLKFGNACGALTCNKYGALSAYESEKEVLKFINRREKRKVAFNI